MKKLIFTFTLSFSVISVISLSAQSVAISTDATRALYQWIENPLKIAIENTPCNSIVVKAEKGKLTGKGCDYIYTTTDSVSIDIIKVGIKRGAKVKWIKEEVLRVRKLPDPSVQLGSFGNFKEVNRIPRNQLTSGQGLRLPIPDGFCDYTNDRVQCIVGYSITVIRNGHTIFSENATDNYFSENFKRFMDIMLIAGDKVVFDNLVALLYQHEIRKLAPLVVIVY